MAMTERTTNEGNARKVRTYCGEKVSVLDVIGEEVITIIKKGENGSFTEFKIEGREAIGDLCSAMKRTCDHKGIK